MADTDNGPILPKKPPHPNVHGTTQSAAEAVDMAAQVATLLNENQTLKRRLQSCLIFIDEFIDDLIENT